LHLGSIYPDDEFVNAFAARDELHSGTLEGEMRTTTGHHPLPRLGGGEPLTQAADQFGVSREQVKVVQCNGRGKPVDIARFIVETVPTCHALVGDVSFINAAGEGQTRRTPNPNTMFEIGLATQCLGPGKVILVFNTDSGRARDLPFDVRNQAMIFWSSPAPGPKPASGGEQANLARALQGALEPTFQEYLTLAVRLGSELNHCFKPLLSFLEQFLRRYIEAERPGFTGETMALFRQAPEGNLLPQLNYVTQVLRAYQREILAPSVVEGITEGDLFAILLQRFHHDCERLAYRHRELCGSDLFRHVEQVGIEAGHLERLIERVINKVPDPVVNEIIASEITGFLREVIEARRQAARCASKEAHPDGEDAKACSN
jgi:hypothetical protein